MVISLWASLDLYSRNENRNKERYRIIIEISVQTKGGFFRHRRDAFSEQKSKSGTTVLQSEGRYRWEGSNFVGAKEKISFGTPVPHPVPEKEIAELNTFLSGHNAHGGGDAFYKEVMGQMNNMKTDIDQSGSFDKQFAQMMIPHHQGAIDMSKSYLKSGAHEEKLKTMANKIIAEQQKEIDELQAWLNNHK